MESEGQRLNQLTERIIGAAIKVHAVLGPGLLEAAYAAALAYELRSQGANVEQERPLPVVYGNVTLDCAYRLDLMVDGEVIVEIKAVDEIAPIHRAQLRSYLRLAHCRVGLLINFNEVLVKNGIVRVVNHFPADTRPIS